MLDLPDVLRKSGNQQYDLMKIADSLVKETDLDEKVALDIAKDVTRFIISNNLNIITAPLIREICNVCLLSKGYEKARLQYTRIGYPYADLEYLYYTYGRSEETIIKHIKQEYEAVKKLIGECEVKE